ncbi:polysaccharide deacetylase family protein [Clostridium massiliamazoniense]|uniref:polysaccharide deacetylase family protein n=1 Tax=Clostridium massiliamazoniense TaxID=1347366 RepID=UPI0006D829ED|nr:polysaccharide deacetylase family protein [Clostridium massiliamazoniense]
MKIKRRKIYFVVLLIINMLLNFNVSAYSASKDYKDEMPIYSVESDEKLVAITFDVNWAEKDYLDDILKVLDDYDVKATFFVMGKWVIYPEGNKEKLVRICNKNHQIGNHSYVHPNFLRINRKQIENEIVKTEKIIYDITGKKTTVFRFPSGAYNKEAVKCVNAMNYKSIQWSKDSVDWKNIGLEKEYNNVMKDIDAGDILLFHNNGENTVENLKRIIPDLQRKGYKLVKLEELMHDGAYIVNENGKQLKIN